MSLSNSFGLFLSACGRRLTIRNVQFETRLKLMPMFDVKSVYVVLICRLRMLFESVRCDRNKD